MKAPVTQQSSRGQTTGSSCDIAEHHCWCFCHLQISPPAITLHLCVPDVQVGIRTPHMGKEVALVLLFINCVGESFYSAVLVDIPLPYKRRRTIKTCI